MADTKYEIADTIYEMTDIKYMKLLTQTMK
jgi:hypothetical protein